MNTAFHSSPIGLDAWLRILAVALSAMVVVGIEKWVVSRRVRRILP
jgi:hypothetical protein